MNKPFRQLVVIFSCFLSERGIGYTLSYSPSGSAYLKFVDRNFIKKIRISDHMANADDSIYANYIVNSTDQRRSAEIKILNDLNPSHDFGRDY